MVKAVACPWHCARRRLARGSPLSALTLGPHESGRELVTGNGESSVIRHGGSNDSRGPVRTWAEPMAGGSGRRRGVVRGRRAWTASAENAAPPSAATARRRVEPGAIGDLPARRDASARPIERGRPPDSVRVWERRLLQLGGASLTRGQGRSLRSKASVALFGSTWNTRPRLCP